jgi:hypothetical protein
MSSRLSKNVKFIIYKTIIFLAVFYGCKTWFLTVREEHKLKVFENSMVKRIFAPNEKILHKEGPHNLYPSTNNNYENQAKEDEIGSRRKRMHIGFRWESQKERGK